MKIEWADTVICQFEIPLEIIAHNLDKSINHLSVESDILEESIF